MRLLAGVSVRTLHVAVAAADGVGGDAVQNAVALSVRREQALAKGVGNQRWGQWQSVRHDEKWVEDYGFDGECSNGWLSLSCLEFYSNKCTK